MLYLLRCSSLAQHHHQRREQNRSIERDDPLTSKDLPTSSLESPTQSIKHNMNGRTELSVTLDKRATTPIANESSATSLSVRAATLSAAKPQELASNTLTSLNITATGNSSNEVILTEYMNPMDLSSFTSALKPNATVSVHVQSSSKDDIQTINTAFLLAGLKGISESKQSDGSRVFTAVKPQTNNGNTVPAKAIKLNLGNDKVGLDDDDDMLIDEDGLLADSSNVLAPPPAMTDKTKGADDCSGRKACENCTCGRADAEKAAESGAQQQPIKTSSCGKCGLGDAFRCASCPYLGKPAFKPGEEHLVLDLQDDL